ncbi:MAG TPA: BatA domain-containing protein [Gemmatimonadaceae bacterium]|nr:BatA domain-containing protein [Gemmatimonadaceae bacterium]
MTFLAPGFLFASLAVAAAVVALHFIVTRQPRAAVLPTARFVPNLPANATARATRPSDLLLMVLRVLLVLAIGAGLARPIFKPSRNVSARVILVDASRSVGDISAIRESAARYYRDGDAVIVFDSAARAVGGKPADSIRALGKTERSGRLSGALVAALRAGSALRDKADSLDLVLVSPLAADEFDAATDSIRSLWRGKATVVRSGAKEIQATVATPVQLRSLSGDPLAVTVARLGSSLSESARIVRDAISGDDAQWIGGGVRTLVDWPVINRPERAIPRAKVDTIGGVVSDSFIVVSAFPRRWAFTPDSIRGARVVARWTDGEPAAIEWTQDKGCVRSVAVPVNPVGDFPLQTSFARFVTSIVSPCAGDKLIPTASSNQIASLAGTGGLAPRDAFEPRGDVRSTLAPWLFGLALVAAIGELFVRRRRDDAVRSITHQQASVGRAA